MNYYCVFVHFDNSKALHLAHNDIKTLNFILKRRYASYIDARRGSIAYVNAFFDKVYGVGAWKHLPENIPATPLNGFQSFTDGYFCTEDANSWKLSLWHKKTDGYLYKTSKVDKIFDVDILEVYEPPFEYESDSVVRKFEKFTFFDKC